MLASDLDMQLLHEKTWRRSQSAFWLSSGVAEVSFGGAEYATSDLGEQYFFEEVIRIAHESLYMIYLKLFDFPGLFQM